ncbi:MAG: tetratricopeptide repeat protein [Treponema sp.]|jgi:tetratricopeptide (TPR) repeat protein|nr:tetratricopeptide repeat protein [Treponema sp.]
MNVKGRIVFLSVPESLRGRIESMARGHEHGKGEDHGGECYGHEAPDMPAEDEFSIDPAIPIPAEIPEGEEKLNLEELSWEMILSGMLKIISPENSAELRREYPSLSAGQIDYYRRFVLTLRPNILEEFTEAAIFKARNRDFDMALEIFDALHGLFPHSPSVLLNRALALEERADLYERQGREDAAAETEAAEAAYERALAAEPPFPRAFFDAGFFCLKRKNYGRAKEYFSRYAEFDDDEEKGEQALSLIKEIEESGLEDESYRSAHELIRQGREQEGMQSIRGFLERRPGVWQGWFVLGWALRRLERWEDSAAAFRKAMELGGDGGDIRNELAICLMELEDFSGARRELETALREDPDNVKIISNLGVLAMKKGDDDEAAAFFRAVLEIEPEDPIAKEFFKR